MARGTLSDEDLDKKPGSLDMSNFEKSLNESFNKTTSGLQAREVAQLDQIEAGLRDNTKPSSDILSEKEEDGQGLYHPTDSTKETTKRRMGAAKRLTGMTRKKKGALIALVATFGISGALVATLFGPATMLINIAENAIATNDSSSTAMERRFMKLFANSTNPDICKGTKIKCKLGKISNNALRKMAKVGVVGLGTDGKAIDTKRLGYPDSNPSSYRIDMPDGKSKIVNAKELAGFLNQKENRALASKVFGARGVFNMRFRAWTGKYLSKKLFRPFGLNRNGGWAKSIDGKLHINERIGGLMKKIPGSEKIGEVSDNLRTKLDSQMGKLKRGGAGYMVAVAGCVGAKIPNYIAAGVAAVQLAQLLNLGMDSALSPASMAKASAIDADAIDTIGTAFTRQVPNEKGEMKSAMDSMYLLAAMGVIKNKLPVSQKFAPGYSVITNPLVGASRTVQGATKDACASIMSPSAMYAAAAADAAVTIAASATIVAGIVKVAASWAISEIVVGIVKATAGEAVKAYLTGLATNKDIENAKGQDFGDAVGLGLLATFSSGGMARHLNVSSESSLASSAQVMRDQENFQREMDIASLSPFDVSSKNTFLGSIVHNLSFAMISNRMYNQNLASVFSNVLRIPSMALSSSLTVGAASYSADSCKYAADFGLSTGDPNTTPAMNAAGLPCLGINEQQANMSSEEALDIIHNSGWIDDSKEISDTDDILDLIDKGYIRRDTPLFDFIDSCSDASSGNYLINSGGCTVPVDTKPTNKDISINHQCKTTADANDPNKSSTVCSGNNLSDVDNTGGSVVGTVDQKALSAMSVFLLDLQVHSAINDEDTENNATPSAPTNPGDWAVSPDHDGGINHGSEAWKSWVAKIGGNGNSSTGVLAPITVSHQQDICSQQNTLNQNGGGNLFHPSAAASAQKLIESYHTDPINGGKYLVPGACFRSISAQQQAWNNYQSGGNLAARPGTSNHGWGLAIDFRISSDTHSMGNSIDSFSSKDYLWLKNNSYKYGWINPLSMQPGMCSGSSCEPWHFQYVGPL